MVNFIASKSVFVTEQNILSDYFQSSVAPYLVLNELHQHKIDRLGSAAGDGSQSASCIAHTQTRGYRTPYFQTGRLFVLMGKRCRCSNR